MERLFSSVPLSPARQIRTYSMLHLAYTLGLCPKKISEISLDDISFSRAELALRDRKSCNPIRIRKNRKYFLKDMAVF